MRAIDRAWNARSWSDYSDLLADELVAYASGETKSHGKQEHIAKAKVFCSAFPDNRVYTDPYLDLFSNEDGSKTCSIARIAGTMTGSLETSSALIQPNHREFDVTFTAVCKWRNGKITDQREYFDMELMLSQLQLQEKSDTDPIHGGETNANSNRSKSSSAERTDRECTTGHQPT